MKNHPAELDRVLSSFYEIIFGPGKERRDRDKMRPSLALERTFLKLRHCESARYTGSEWKITFVIWHNI